MYASAYSRTTHKKCAKLQKLFDICKKKDKKTCVFVKKAVILQPKLENIMSELIDHATLSAMYRRWAYMVIAIVASAFMFTRPVFSFQQDKGIIYVRSFSMDQKRFYVTQTEMKTGATEITAVSSVKWLYYCNKAMLWGSILCFLCFFSNPVRLGITYAVAAISGFYYVLMVYYSMYLSDLHYATISPNFMAIFPGIVCAMMVLTGKNIIRDGIDRTDRALERYDF